MPIPMIGKIILYLDISIFAAYCIIVFFWQIMVLKGKSMNNPDGTTDDWHEQKLFYGIALADIVIAIPTALTGIILIFLEWKLGYYLAGLASFWFLWANTLATATSLRFEKPKITIMWIIAFPFGAIAAIIYIIWSLIYFDKIF